MDNYLLISDAAKEVHVESHVLRYWEEELHLPIRRNELGHRYYTKEDVERFKQIKSMKERGLQLKAIKMILKDGKIDVMLPEEAKRESYPETGEMYMDRQVDNTMLERQQADRMALERQQMGRGMADRAQMDSGLIDRSYRDGWQTEDLPERKGMAIDIVDSRDAQVIKETKEEKARRLQWLLQQLIRETLQENNKELCQNIKECVVKELDYQFRAQEEREEERDRLQSRRNEEYYQRMDELLRRKSRLGKGIQGKESVRREKKQKVQTKQTIGGASAEEAEREGRRGEQTVNEQKIRVRMMREDECGNDMEYESLESAPTGKKGNCVSAEKREMAEERKESKSREIMEEKRKEKKKEKRKRHSIF